MENAMFFNILKPMAREETKFTKKLCNYEEDPCVERVYLVANNKDVLAVTRKSSHQNAGMNRNTPSLY
jgi:hypothetical protein